MIAKREASEIVAIEAIPARPGQEIEGILAREKRQMNRGLRGGNGGALAAGLGVATAPKRTRSGGA